MWPCIWTTAPSSSWLFRNTKNRRAGCPGQHHVQAGRIGASTKRLQGQTTLFSLDSLYPEVEKARSRTALKNVILTSLEAYLPEKPTLPVPSGAGMGGRSFPDTISLEAFIHRSGEQPLCHVSDLKKELAVLQYTGGQRHTQRGDDQPLWPGSANLVMLHWYHHRENDVFMGVTPFFHVMGQINVMCVPLVCRRQDNNFIPLCSGGGGPGYYPVSMHLLGGAYHRHYCLAQPANIKDYDFSSFRCLWTGGVPDFQRNSKRD